MTPVEIEREIDRVLAEIPKATELVATERLAAKKAARDFKLALAEHRHADSGSRADREDRALLAHARLWEQMDIAEVTARRADDLKSDLRELLSGLQTEAKLIHQAYNVEGRMR